MPTPEEFLTVTQWSAIATVSFGLLTLLAFGFSWGIRFRLVGITGFMGVLTVGFLGLSFEPFTSTQVPGAVPYTTVYDSGAAQIAIRVPQSIGPEALEATLQQAANNLFKPSRLGVRGQTPIIRARTIIHQPGGISELVYLGQVQPTSEGSGGLTIAINRDRVARINAEASS